MDTGYEVGQCRRWNVARAVGGRDCIPRDCLTVTVMTSSGGSSQSLPQAEGTHSQHRECSFSPGKGEPTLRSQAAKNRQDRRLTAGRWGRGSGRDKDVDGGWERLFHRQPLEAEIMTREEPHQQYFLWVKFFWVRKCFPIHYSFVPFSCEGSEPAWVGGQGGHKV